jgi:hypothetical protein
MTVRSSAPPPRRNNTSKSRTAATAMMTQTHGSIVRSLPSLIDRCLPVEAPRHTPGEATRTTSRWPSTARSRRDGPLRLADGSGCNAIGARPPGFRKPWVPGRSGPRPPPGDALGRRRGTRAVARAASRARSGCSGTERFGIGTPHRCVRRRPSVDPSPRSRAGSRRVGADRARDRLPSCSSALLGSGWTAGRALPPTEPAQTWDRPTFSGHRSRPSRAGTGVSRPSLS